MANTSPDQEGGSLRGSQRGFIKDAADNKGACVLDLPGDMKTCGQKSSTPEGTAIKQKGGRSVTVKLPEIFEEIHTTTG